MACSAGAMEPGGSPGAVPPPPGALPRDKNLLSHLDTTPCHYHRDPSPQGAAGLLSVQAALDLASVQTAA